MKLTLLAYLLVLLFMLFMFAGIINKIWSIHNENKTNARKDLIERGNRIEQNYCKQNKDLAKNFKFISIRSCYITDQKVSCQETQFCERYL